MPGSSGGPIVDLDGRLLGINTNRLGNGFYLAIAADAALRDRVTALGRGESPKRRRLGVGLAPVARRAPAASRGRPAGAGRPARARGRGRLPRREGRDRRGRPASWPSAARRSPAPTTCSRRWQARVPRDHPRPWRGRANGDGGGVIAADDRVAEALETRRDASTSPPPAAVRRAAADRARLPQRRRAHPHQRPARLSARLDRQPAGRPAVHVPPEARRRRPTCRPPGG